MSSKWPASSAGKLDFAKFEEDWAEDSLKQWKSPQKCTTTLANPNMNICILAPSFENILATQPSRQEDDCCIIHAPSNFYLSHRISCPSSRHISLIALCQHCRILRAVRILLVAKSFSGMTAYTNTTSCALTIPRMTLDVLKTL
jgi:hypothetical protein